MLRAIAVMAAAATCAWGWSATAEPLRKWTIGSWEVSEIRDADSIVAIACLGCEIPVAEIYRNAEKYPA